MLLEKLPGLEVLQLECCCIGSGLAGVLPELCSMLACACARGRVCTQTCIHACIQTSMHTCTHTRMHELC